MSRLLYGFLAMSILLHQQVHAGQATQESTIMSSRPQDPKTPIHMLKSSTHF